MATVKTSQSHPLRIDTVTVGDRGGCIGLTFCPGKKHDGLIEGRWERDLGLDLDAVQQWGARALLTLMPEDELPEVEVDAGRLRRETEARGIEWHHLAIPDQHPPGEEFEDLWIYSGCRLRSLLSRGDAIVVHCKGGIGRTGTVAARLLVEFGEDPAEAMLRVRKARLGSIENEAQEGYVLRCRSTAPGQERVAGSLLGGAIGDAFGYEIEFMPLPKIRQRFGPEGLHEPVLHDGRLLVSDDTQMTLFTIEGLLAGLDTDAFNAGEALNGVRQAYLDWLETQSGTDRRRSGLGWLAHQPVLRVPRAPGGTCLSALASGGTGAMERPINNSKGCGGAMRAVPFGFVWSLDAPGAFELAARAAALTHGHPSGYLSAGLVAAIVRDLMEGTPFASAVAHALEILRTYPAHEETLSAAESALRAAANPRQDHAETVESLGCGWVGEEAVAIAIYSVLAAKSFSEGIRIAANHGGDSDSTASIAGQFWGAAHGLDGIPHEWVTRLDVLGPLLHVTRQALEAGLTLPRGPQRNPRC